MADASMTDAVVLGADLKGLELLFDYTKFHIGFYLSLASAFVTIASLKRGEVFVINLSRFFVWLTLGSFLVAGFAGGVIASSITQCYGYTLSAPQARCPSADSFLLQRLGPLDMEWFTGRTWTQIEHCAFWIALLSAVASFAKGAPTDSPSKKEPSEVRISGAIAVLRTIQNAGDDAR